MAAPQGENAPTYPYQPHAPSQAWRRFLHATNKTLPAMLGKSLRRQRRTVRRLR